MGVVKTSLETEAAVVRRYLAEESSTQIGHALGLSPSTVTEILKRNDVPRRNLRSALALAFNSPLEISKDRLQELYWHPDRPSRGTLSRTLGMSRETLAKLLKEHGIPVRSAAEQLREEIRQGRFKPPVNRNGGQPDFGERMAPSRRGKSLPSEVRQKMAVAKRKTASRPCGWCGALMIGPPYALRSACSASHAHFWRVHKRKRPDQPRPLIVERLRALVEERLRLLRERNRDGTLQPPRWDQLEKLGAEIGARELELEAVLNGYVGL